MNDSMDNLNKAIDSSGGKLLWRIGEIILAAIITAFIYNISNKMDSFSQFVNHEQVTDAQRDQNIALLQAQLNGLQKVSDATVQSLQQIGNQVTHNTDDITNLKNTQNYEIRTSRPSH